MAAIVDGYTRVSTDPQEENTSLDEQEACIRQYCRENGLILGMIHREVWSGYQYRERNKLTLMRERYRDGKIQGVVIRNLDRLSRSQVHNAILMEEMEHHKIALHCVKEKIDDTPMGKFVRMVLAFVAEVEREKIMDRTMTGRISMAKKGEFKEGPKNLYGYKWHDEEKKDYRIIDGPAAVVLVVPASQVARAGQVLLVARAFWMRQTVSPARQFVALAYAGSACSSQLEQGRSVMDCVSALL